MSAGSEAVRFRHRDFVDVDAFPDVGQAIAMLDLFRGDGDGPQERHAEFARTVLLELGPAQRVLDVGCGLGHDAIAIARVVAPGGSVVATDKSVAYVEEARRRADGFPNVEFRHADATDLPFEAESFDRVHMNRVLMYVPEPEEAIAEAFRVLRPGGRALFVEPDAAADFADHPDGRLGDLVTPLVGEVVNPRIGRELRRFAVMAGFENVQTDGFLMNIETAPPAPVADALFKELAEAGAITDEEATSLIAWAIQAGAAGTFFAAHVVVRALATK